MTNFFKGLQNLIDKIFMILIIINVAWFFVSESTYPSPEGLGLLYIETKGMLVFVSSISLLVFGLFINWVLGSFVFEPKGRSRNFERLIKMEMTLQKVEDVISKIDSNVKNIQSEVEKVKEKQINQKVEDVISKIDSNVKNIQSEVEKVKEQQNKIDNKQNQNVNE